MPPTDSQPPADSPDQLGDDAQTALPPGRPKRRRLLIAAAVTLVVAAAAVAAVALINRTTDGGPLLMIPEETMSSAQAKVGTQTMYGYPQVKNSGSVAIELVGANLLPADGAGTATITETRVGGREATGAGPWPNDISNPANTHPLAGHIVKPGEEVSILFVLDVHKAGHSRWTRTEVTYKVDGRKYKTGTDNGFTVCTPIDSTTTGCIRALNEKERVEQPKTPQ